MSTKQILTASFLIIALSFAYYLVIHLPNKQKAEQQIELKKIESQKEQAKNRQQIEQGWKLYEEENKLAKDKAISECMKELKEEYDAGNISEQGIYTVEDAKTFIDARVDTCLKFKGFSE